jgi:membrane protease YdiL (CAAX protease family)
MKVFILTIVVIVATLFLVFSSSVLSRIGVSLHSNTFINSTAKYQIFAFFVACVVLLFTVWLNPSSKILFQFGKTSTIALKESWLGINGKSTWLSNGLQLLFIISLATGFFMFIGVKNSNSFQSFDWRYIPIILLFALTNSFSEEIIYRFGIVGGLLNFTPKITILLISAILFGLPHYGGNPSGFVGVIMAGLMGYILAKSTIETQGLGIAWIIHFVQDVIIFTALLMMHVK